jgi:hypothetical protein
MLLGACSVLLGVGLLGLGLTNHAALAAQTRPSHLQRVAEAKVVDAVTPLTEPSTTEPATTTTQAAATPAPPNVRGALPTGKGMWIWQPWKAENGNVQAMVARAQAAGLTHIYVRTGSSVTGFDAGPFLNSLLPEAHRAGIRVYGWQFPYLDDVGGDVVRALQAIKYGTPGGERIDGFAADIEFRSMGVNITPFTAAAYGASLRHEVGKDYPLIAVVPRPSAGTKFYPYDQIVKDFDAVAPMIYWMQTDPKYAIDLAFDRLGNYGKPVLPIGQAYDGVREGGPPGVPSPDAIHRFMDAAVARGATGISFWSWQHANAEAWLAIANSPMFQLPASVPQLLRTDQIRAFQVLLTTLGFPIKADGRWGAESDAMLRKYQAAAHLNVTGLLDNETRAMLLKPVPPPLKP